MTGKVSTQLFVQCSHLSGTQEINISNFFYSWLYSMHCTTYVTSHYHLTVSCVLMTMLGSLTHVVTLCFAVSWNFQCQSLVQVFPGFSRCISLHTFRAFVLRRKILTFSVSPNNWNVILRPSYLRSFAGVLQSATLISHHVVTIAGSNSQALVALTFRWFYYLDFIVNLVICTGKDASWLMSMPGSRTDFDSVITIPPGPVYSVYISGAGSTVLGISQKWIAGYFPRPFSRLPLQIRNISSDPYPLRDFCIISKQWCLGYIWVNYSE